MDPSRTIRPYRLGETEGDPVWFLGSLVTLKVGGAATRGRLSIVEVVNPAGFAPVTSDRTRPHSLDRS